MQGTHLKMLDFPAGVNLLRNVLIHIKAEEELRSFYENKLGPAHQAKLAAFLNQRFRFLFENLGREHFNKEWFEILTDVSNPSLRSIKIKTATPIGNLRLLYVIADGRAVVLVSFIERKKDDYRRAIGIAQKRYEDTFE